MQTYEQEAEIINTPKEQPQAYDPYSGYNPEMTQAQEYQENELFQQGNDLRVIQEYNREENLPTKLKNRMWALVSKSIKLGFWDEKDQQEIFLHKNIIKVGQIMSQPRHKYTFEDRHQMNQVDFLVYADYKRGRGMEKYRINERTLQATSVQQHIQGYGNMGGGKRGGMLAGLKSFFG